jgi:trimethylamine:corrinoid methyltransferase-like protein
MQLPILLQDEVRAIHQATPRTLSEVGVFSDDEEARILFLDHALCSINRDLLGHLFVSSQ